MSIKHTVQEIRFAAKKKYDQLVASYKNQPGHTEMSKEGWFQTGYIEGYLLATEDIRKNREQKEKAALLEIMKRFPEDCADNYKANETDGKCYSTTCLLSGIPEMKEVIRKQGCECFLDVAVIDILERRKEKEKGN
jgi:hypothetical protein